MKILVVEDDQTIAQTLKLLLSHYNYATDIAADGETGLQMAEAFEYDLILLDVVLPKLNGISLCQLLRAKGLQIPILLLTGQGEGRQKAIALNLGADDYVVKPFDAEELIARVQALLRRGKSASQPILTWGPLSVDPSHRRIAYGTHLLSVTPKEYAILELFLRNPQSVLSARMILDHAWTSLESPGEEAVRVHIKELRHKLTAVGAPKDFIKTTHRVGYQLNPQYSNFLAAQVEQQPTAPQIAELATVNEELRLTLEEFQATEEELRLQNEQLAAAQQTLELERQRYQDLFEFAPDAYVVTNTFGVIQEANRVASNLFQVDSQSLIGKPLINFIAECDRHNFSLQLTQSSSIQNWEINVKPKVGNPVPVLVAVTSIKNLQGEITVRRWALHDIRVRKEMEQQLQVAHDELEMRVAERTAELALSNRSLQRQKNQWKALFDHALDAIVVINDDGQFVDANPAAYHLFGVSEAELLRSSIADFAEPNLNVDQHWQELLQHRQLSGEFNLQRWDGTVRNVELTAIANFVPGRHLSILRDISDRKRREANAVFLDEITNDFSRLLSANEIMQTVGAKLGTYLNLSTCLFVAIDEAQDQAIVEYVWHTADTPDLTGVYPLSDYISEEFQQAAQSREAVIVRDVQTSSCINSDRHTALKIKALVTVPFHRSGRWKYSFTAADSVVRDWHEDEIELIREVTTRLFPRLERAHAEAALRENEQMLRLALASAQAGFWHWEIDTGKLIWSLENYSLHGIDPAQDPPQFNDWYDTLLHPDDRTWVHQHLSRVLEQRLPNLHIEFRILHHQRGIRWLLGLGHLTLNEQGEPIRLSGINLDITERKQSELEIRKFVALADNSSEFIGMCDLNFVPFYVNPAGKQLVGLANLEQYQTTPVKDFFFPEDQDFIIHNFFPQVLQEGRAEVEIRFRHFQTGEALWMIYSVICIKDERDEAIALAAFSRDITDRKLIEQKNREQAALLDISSDAIFVRDLNHHILSWNQGAERLYGWSAAEAIGQSVGELLQSATHQLPEIIETLFSQGEWRGEIQGITKTGQQVTVESRWTLVRDETGQPKSILSVDTDVTEKKQLEAQFYRAQRLESLGTLASGIAHDLNNVLTPILAIAQLLRLHQPALEEQLPELLQVLEDSAKRGASLIRQILTFSRGTGGERSIVQIAPLLEEVINVVQQTFPKAISIRQNIPEQSWLVSADSTYLHQVFMNLCVNARDAMPNGGTLSFSAEQCFIDQAFTQTNLDAQIGDYVAVTIADTGTGIPPEVREHMFDPFFTTKEPGQGTGLGLATVLGIVKNYGGFLQVLSEVGQGTQIKVYLPIVTGTQTPSIHPQEQLSGDGELVLIVDDDVAVQHSTQVLLENHRYTTLSANDGMQAIALYTQHQDEISLVLLDVMMPNMSGISLIHNLKEINPTVVIIAISGLPANQELAIAAGADAFLSKPYTVETLLGTFHSLIPL